MPTAPRAGPAVCDVVGTVPTPAAAEPIGTVGVAPRVAVPVAAGATVRGAPAPPTAATLTDSALALAAEPACALLRAMFAAPPLAGAPAEGLPTPAARSAFARVMFVVDAEAGLSLFIARSFGAPAGC